MFAPKPDPKATPKAKPAPVPKRKEPGGTHPAATLVGQKLSTRARRGTDTKEGHASAIVERAKEFIDSHRNNKGSGITSLKERAKFQKERDRAARGIKRARATMRKADPELAAKIGEQRARAQAKRSRQGRFAFG